MPKQPTTLDERHYRQLQQLGKSISAHKEFLIKCSRCKLDVDQEMNVTNSQLQLISDIMREFLPNFPQDGK